MIYPLRYGEVSHAQHSNQFLFALFADLSLLGVLAGTQLPGYFQATNALGLHALTLFVWHGVTVLLASYGAIGLFSGLAATRCAGELLDRFGVK